MAKRNKMAAEPAPLGRPQRRGAAGQAGAPSPNHLSPPEKQPTLLAVSLVLFALWFTFLLVTALGG